MPTPLAWDWRVAATSRDGERERRRLRLRLFGGGLVSLTAAGVALRFGPAWLAVALASSGVAALTLAAMGSKIVLRRVGAVLSATGRLTGQAVGALLLTPLYLAFFLPFGLWRRWRHDPLALRPDPGAESYWTDRGSRPASHERPF